MGMFSWCCKGCGYELIHGETVRLNGQKQVYDGYGGLADIDFDDVSAWHDKCYLKASYQNRMDETPSKHAPNQGMGSTKLEFLSGYVENASTKYFLSLYSYFDKKFETFFYTNNEHFEGLNSWLAKLDDARNSLPSPFDVFDFSSLLREDDDNKLMLMIGPSPEDNIKVFNTVKDAILKGMQVVERDFPSNFICDLVIYGQQGEIEGSVYECRINESEVEILYDLG